MTLHLQHSVGGIVNWGGIEDGTRGVHAHGNLTVGDFAVILDNGRPLGEPKPITEMFVYADGLVGIVTRKPGAWGSSSVDGLRWTGNGWSTGRHGRTIRPARPDQPVQGTLFEVTR